MLSQPRLLKQKEARNKVTKLVLLVTSLVRSYDHLTSLVRSYDHLTSLVRSYDHLVLAEGEHYRAIHSVDDVKCH